MNIIERAHKPLNLKEFSSEEDLTGSPVNGGFDTLNFPEEEQHILRMPIRLDGVEIGLPEELMWLQGVYSYVDAFQKEVVKKDHPFVYITVRHGDVQSTTDDEWHVDGFSMRIEHDPEQNYIMSSDSTDIYNHPINIPDDFDPLRYNIHSFFDHEIDEDSVNIKKTLPYNLYLIDPYVVHRRPPETNGQKKRTFFRISFVPIEIEDDANTHNPLMESKRVFNNKDIRDSLVDYHKEYNNA